MKHSAIDRKGQNTSLLMPLSHKKVEEVLLFDKLWSIYAMNGELRRGDQRVPPGPLVLCPFFMLVRK